MDRARVCIYIEGEMTVEGKLVHRAGRRVAFIVVPLAVLAFGEGALASPGTMLSGYGGASSTPNVVVALPPAPSPSQAPAVPTVKSPTSTPATVAPARKPTVAGVSAAQPQPEQAGALPFTGLDVGFVLGAGLLLLGMGIALRRAARRQER
jgi:hypothetical protein